jgi:hypothetical protein
VGEGCDGEGSEGEGSVGMGCDGEGSVGEGSVGEGCDAQGSEGEGEATSSWPAWSASPLLGAAAHGTTTSPSLRGSPATSQSLMWPKALTRSITALLVNLALLLITIYG